MRITRDMLLKIAADTVAERTTADPGILSAYMHGSLLGQAPLLGGTADIDLTFVYPDGEARREIVRLTDEVHLDIWRHPQSMYADGRTLREMAWEGSTLYHCKILYDPKHFLDFTQANVRGQFDRADTVMRRAQPWLETARRAWLRFNSRKVEANPATIGEYLQALEKTANAIASLSGPPMTTRRFLLDFPARAEAAGQPGLAVGLVGLLGGNELEVDTMRGWLLSWEAAYDAAEGDGDLHSHRKQYYLRAMAAMVAGDTPQAALWPLLRTWTKAVGMLGGTGAHTRAWMAACDQLDLLGEHFEAKLAGLDAYLDTVEELFEDWRRERGV